MKVARADRVKSLNNETPMSHQAFASWGPSYTNREAQCGFTGNLSKYEPVIALQCHMASAVGGPQDSGLIYQFPIVAIENMTKWVAQKSISYFITVLERRSLNVASRTVVLRTLQGRTSHCN